jgi:prohibitin 1
MSGLFSGFAGRLAMTSFVIGGAGIFVNSCLYNVDAGQRAVIFDQFQGVKEKVYDEGTHFRIPVIQRPVIYDVRTRPRVISSTTGTKDLQMVQVSLRVLFKPDVDKLPTIYKTLGTDYEERVLPSIGNEVLKSIVAQFNADQLLMLRDRVSSEVRDSLTRRAEEFGLKLDDVSITHLAFSREFTKAIEDKQVAEQEAERSKHVVAKAEQEMKAAIIQAEGESEAAELIAQAMSEHGEGLIDVRRIETAKEIAATLATARNVTYLPNSGLVVVQ